MRLLLALLGVLALAGPASASGPNRLSVAGSVEQIAFDGSQVAISSHLEEGGQRCDRAEEWDLATGKVVHFGLAGEQECHGSGQGNDDPVTDIAFGGGRALWVTAQFSNHSHCTHLETATVAEPAATVVPHPLCNGYTDDTAFETEGDGSLIAVESYIDCEYEPDCLNGVVRLDPALYRLDGSKLTKLASGNDVYRLFSVDSGRIAVQSKNGDLQIRSSSGAVLQTLPFERGEVGNAKLDGSSIIVRTKEALEVYTIGATKPEETWPLPRADRLQDVSGGLAVYLVTASGLTAVHVLRLSDGRDRTVVSGVKGILDAQIEPSGLVYAYNDWAAGTRPGRVVFVPANRLLHALR